MKHFIPLVALIVITSVKGDGYAGYKVYRVLPLEKYQVGALKILRENNRLDFWSPLRNDGSPLDIMVNPEDQIWFINFLKEVSINYEVLINDMQEVILKERVSQLLSPKRNKGQVDFTRYLRHDEINSYLYRLAQNYPNLVTLQTIGKSYEGRDLKLVKISSNPNANKSVIFIDAGIHAREWIAPPVALYAINQLVENKTNLNLIENLDWHILPVVNPDGYEYTHQSTNQRLWRKTRQPGAECVGTDGNRNFGYHWSEVGSSDQECSEVYHGKHAFSELETAAIRDYILANKDRIKLYLTVHSYGQLIVYPWSYAYEMPENHEQLQAVGELVAESIRNVSGTKYTVANSFAVFGAIAGSSDDWAKGGAGIELSYTLELPKGGWWGFDPPPNRILPVVVETWEGLKAFHNYIVQTFT